MNSRMVEFLVVAEKIRELPEDVQQYIQTLEKKNLNLEKSKGVLKKKIDRLTEELRLALYRKFGRNSEKLDPSQNELFGEAENEVEAPTLESEDITVPAHKRKKSGRKPLDPNIP